MVLKIVTCLCSRPTCTQTKGEKTEKKWGRYTNNVCFKAAWQIRTTNRMVHTDTRQWVSDGGRWVIHGGLKESRPSSYKSLPLRINPLRSRGWLNFHSISCFVSLTPSFSDATFERNPCPSACFLDTEASSFGYKELINFKRKKHLFLTMQVSSEQIDFLQSSHVALHFLCSRRFSKQPIWKLNAVKTRD